MPTCHFTGDLDGPVEGANDARRHGAGQSERGADRHDGLAHLDHDDEPSEMTLSWREVWTLSTARSVCGSRPVIVAGLV
jgi:hypothetical protein